MSPDNIKVSNQKKASEISFLRMTVGGLLAIAVIEGMLLMKSMGAERVVITPPKIEKSFWVTPEGASKSYLEQMTYWYAGLALTTTKSTGEFQKKLFLEYASPEKRGKLEVEANERLSFLEKNNASTTFSVQSLQADENLMRVSVTGELDTYVQDKRISTRHVIYAMGFKIINGKFYVDEFKETNDKDIFGTGTAVK